MSLILENLPESEQPEHDVFTCPKCESDDGYYVRLLIGHPYLYDRYGRPEGVGDEYFIRGGQKYYCSNCHKNISRYVKKVRCSP